MGMTGSLKNKTVRGIGWSFIDNISNQGITFLIGIVLARLLSPEEYGLIGIVTIFISVCNSIVDSGFSNALIRKNNVNDHDYNTIFFTNIAFSVVLFVIIFLLADAIAMFFNQPLLLPLIRAMSIIIIINAFAIVQRVIFVKKIDFKTQTKISFISSVLGGVVGICMAIYDMGVWSLVGQQITRQSLNTILLWVYSKWTPKLLFSKNSFKELFGFGWKLLVSGLIDTIWREMYQVIIGKCYTPATLGQYTRAQQFSGIFSSNITSVIQRVSYPVLASIQNDAGRLKQAYRRVIKITMLITFVLMLGMVAVSRPMIYVLIGSKWEIAAKFLPIICLQMMLYPLHAINLNMLQVQGRSDLFLRLEIIKKTVSIIPILLGVFVNIYWMLWSSVFTGIFSYYLNSFYSGKLLDYTFSQQVKDIIPSFIIAVIMCLAVYPITFLSISPVLQLVLQITFGIVIIITLCEIIKLPEYLELKGIVTPIVKKIFKLK